jgi:hypothetical protein
MVRTPISRAEMLKMVRTRLAFAPYCGNVGDIRITGDLIEWAVHLLDRPSPEHPCHGEIRAIVADLSAKYALAPEG